MPQETDLVTGNQIVQEEARADPQAIVNYRIGLSAADGTVKPAANSGLFNSNPGYRGKVRVFVESTGGPGQLVVRPYLRSGGSTGHVATGTAFPHSGSPNYDCSFDVALDGDDVAVLVESLVGGASPTVSIYLSYR